MRAIGVSAFGQKRPLDFPCRSPPCGRSECQLSAISRRSSFSVGARHAGDRCVGFRPRAARRFSPVGARHAGDRCVSFRPKGDIQTQSRKNAPRNIRMALSPGNRRERCRSTTLVCEVRNAPTQPWLSCLGGGILAILEFNNRCRRAVSFRRREITPAALYLEGGDFLRLRTIITSEDCKVTWRPTVNHGLAIS